MRYSVLAELVLAVHAAFIVFAVFGGLLVIAALAMRAENSPRPGG